MSLLLAATLKKADASRLWAQQLDWLKIIVFFPAKLLKWATTL